MEANDHTLLMGYVCGMRKVAKRGKSVHECS